MSVASTSRRPLSSGIFIGHLKGAPPHHHGGVFAQTLPGAPPSGSSLRDPQLQVGVTGDAEEVVPFDRHARGRGACMLKSHNLLPAGTAGVQRLWLRLAQLGGISTKRGRFFWRKSSPGRTVAAALSGSRIRAATFQAEVPHEREGVWAHPRPSGGQSTGKKPPSGNLIRPFFLFLLSRS